MKTILLLLLLQKYFFMTYDIFIDFILIQHFENLYQFVCQF